MKEKQNSGILIKSSMNYGLIMGIIWLVKYLFLMASSSAPFLGAVYWGATISVPYVTYVMMLKFRAEIGGNIRFSEAWKFGVMVCFFASIIVSLLHYVHYRYIAPPEYLSNAFAETLKFLEDSGLDSAKSAAVNLNLSPINLAMQQILNNIIYAMIWTLPVAFFAKRKKIVENINK